MIFVKNCKLQVKKFNRTHYLNQTSDQDVYLFEWFDLMTKRFNVTKHEFDQLKYIVTLIGCTLAKVIKGGVVIKGGGGNFGKNFLVKIKKM